MADSYNELLGDVSLDGFWPLQDDAADAGSGNVTDESGNANNGTLLAGATNVNTSDVSTTGPNGYLQKAFTLNGTNEFISANAAAPSDEPFTMFAWVKLSTASSDQCVLSVADGALSNKQFRLMVLGPQETLSATAFDGTLQESNGTDVVTGTWQFVAGVYTSGTSRTSFSSDALNTTDTNSVAISACDALDIGRTADSTPTAYFGEEISGPGVFSRALTEAELQQLGAGPELNYVSGVDFQSDGTYDVGTWALPSPFASGSNGTALYSIVAVESDGTEVDTASTATGTLDLSSAAGETVYLMVRVSNDGGYDIGDHATRTPSYGLSGDGYYELASVTAAAGGTAVPIFAHHYRTLARA